MRSRQAFGRQQTRSRQAELSPADDRDATGTLTLRSHKTAAEQIDPNSDHGDFTGPCDQRQTTRLRNIPDAIGRSRGLLISASHSGIVIE